MNPSTIQRATISMWPSAAREAGSCRSARTAVPIWGRNLGHQVGAGKAPDIPPCASDGPWSNLYTTPRRSGHVRSSRTRFLAAGRDGGMQSDAWNAGATTAETRGRSQGVDLRQLFGWSARPPFARVLPDRAVRIRHGGTSGRRWTHPGAVPRVARRTRLRSREDVLPSTVEAGVLRRH